MKSDLPARWFRRRRKERQEFLVNVSQSCVVFQQRFIDLGEALQNCGVRRNSFAQFDKRPNNINAHCNGAIASQDVGGLECAVFGKGPWPVSLTSALSPLGVPSSKVAICDVKAANSSAVS